MSAGALPDAAEGGAPPLAGAEDQVRRDTAWIEYLIPLGRPRALYHTRGC